MDYTLSQRFRFHAAQGNDMRLESYGIEIGNDYRVMGTIITILNADYERVRFDDTDKWTSGK